MKDTRIILSLIVLFILMGGSASAQIPQTINYQGSLNQAGSGTPVNGSVSITCTLYDALTGGTALWTETHASVPVEDGIYSVILGTVTPLDTLAFDQPYYLKLTIDGEDLTPRQPLTSVPYALHAKSVDGLTVSGRWVGIGTSSPNGLLQIGDFSQGDVGIFRFKNGGLLLEGGGSTSYPAISISDENRHNALQLGIGQKLEKVLDCALNNEHTLRFRGIGDFFQISDFTADTSLVIGTPSTLPNIMRIGPIWSTEGLAITDNANRVGLFVNAFDGSVGVGTTTSSGLLQIGDLTSGAETAFKFKQVAFSLIGGTELNYPYIEFKDENHQRACYIGWGSKTGKTIDWRFENGHKLYLTGEGELVQFYDATNGNSLLLGTDAQLTDFLRLRPTGGTGLAITNNGDTVGLFVRASDGNVGIKTTNPQYELDVNGQIRAGSWVSPSDIRWKKAITPCDDALERVTQLQGVTFQWSDPSRGEGPQIGVIAQDVEQVFPEVVSTDSEGYKSVAYDRLVAPLIEAVKELKAENEHYQQEIETLKAEKIRMQVENTQMKEDFERRMTALEALIYQH